MSPASVASVASVAVSSPRPACLLPASCLILLLLLQDPPAAIFLHTIFYACFGRSFRPRFLPPSMTSRSPHFPLILLPSVPPRLVPLFVKTPPSFVYSPPPLPFSCYSSFSPRPLWRPKHLSLLPLSANSYILPHPLTSAAAHTDWPDCQQHAFAATPGRQHPPNPTAFERADTSTKRNSLRRAGGQTGRPTASRRNPWVAPLPCLVCPTAPSTSFLSCPVQPRQTSGQQPVSVAFWTALRLTG